MPSYSIVSAKGETDHVTVIVGPEARKYVIHKTFLSHYSEYFDNALNGSWEEAEDRTIALDDIEPRTFDFFVDWLYSQNLPATDEDWSVVTETKRLRDLSIVKVCAFGDRFMVPKLLQDANNHYIDTWISSMHPPSYNTVIYAFDNLRTDIRLLEFLVDTHCAFWKRDHDDLNEAQKAQQCQLPNEFLVRVMYRYSELKDTGKDGKDLDRSSYHEHSSHEEREGCCLQIQW
jgi:hypothetical protein